MDDLWNLFGGVRNGLILANRTGAVIWSSSVAREILSRNADRISMVADRLQLPSGKEILPRVLARGKTFHFVLNSRGKQPLFLIGIGLENRSLQWFSKHDDGLAVIMIDPDLSPKPNCDILRDLFDLTPTECAIAERLAAGKSATEIAPELNISLHTARSHIKHLLQKTGTKRQPKLVRLLLSIPPLSRDVITGTESHKRSLSFG